MKHIPTVSTLLTLVMEVASENGEGSRRRGAGPGEGVRGGDIGSSI